MTRRGQAQPTVTVSAADDDGDLPPNSKKIKLINIKIHEYDITIPLVKRIKIHADAFSKSDNNAAPKLQVGYWSKTDDSNYTGPYYVLTDSDTYRGAVRSGRVTECDCMIYRYESETAFLARHAILNHLPTGYDPLKLGRMVRKLQTVSTTSRAESTSARRAVNMIMQSCVGTVDQKFIALDLDDEAVRIISSMCEWLGERLTRFDLPYYIPHAISKVAAGMQSEMAEQISLIVRGGSVTDARFSWPAPEEISIMSDTPLFRGEGASNDKVATVVDATESVIKDDLFDKSDNNVIFAVPESTGGKKSGKRTGRKQSTGKTTLNNNNNGNVILPNTKDAMIIQGESHAPYVVDLRTKRVSMVDERDDVTVLREIGGGENISNSKSTAAAATKSKKRPAYLMPHAACEWLLKAENENNTIANVNMFMFDSISDFEKFAKKNNNKKKPLRGVIIYK